MKVGNVTFLGDSREKPVETKPFVAQLLKYVVEAHYGGTAIFVEPVWVRAPMRDNTIWEGVVYIFDLHGHPEGERAYTWTIPRTNGKSQYFAVLHEGVVTSPKDAVRTAGRAISFASH